jgi:hypothetical protein
MPHLPMIGEIDPTTVLDVLLCFGRRVVRSALKPAACALAALLTLTLQVQSVEHGVIRLPLLESKEATSFNGPRTLIVYDTCRNVHWAIASGGLWVSSNDGAQWDPVTVPDGSTLLSNASIWMNGCQVVCQWSSPTFGNQHVVAVIEGATWRVLQSPFGAVYATKPMAVTAGRYMMRMDYRRLLHYSSDDGQTWDTMTVPAPATSDGFQWMQQVAMDRVALLIDSAFALVHGPGGDRPTLLHVPVGTRLFRYITPSVLLASGLSGTSTSWMAVSSDSGATWETLEEIRIRNGDSLRYGKDHGLNARWMEPVPNGAIVCVVADGTVLQYTVADNSWTSPGRIPGLRTSEDQLLVTTDSDGDLTFMSRRALFRRSSNDTLLHQVASRIPPLSGFSVHRSVIVTVGPWGAFRSIDEGASWTLCGVPDSVFSPENPGSRVLQSGLVERLAILHDTVYVAATSHLMVGTLSDSATKLEYYLAGADPYNCSNGRQTAMGRALSAFDGRRAYRRGGPSVYPSAYPILITPINDGGGLWFGMLRDSTLVAVGDTMQMSTDNGATWVTGGMGRPGMGRRRSSVSKILQISSDTWLSAFRGWRVELSDTTIRMPGGIYRSTDRGATWSPCTIEPSDASYVWDIEELPSGDLLATAADVSSTEDESSLIVGDAVLLRSVDGGNTWSVALPLPGRQRLALPLGYQIDVDEAGHVAVLDESSVWLSRDSARSWQQFDVPDVFNRCLLDVAISSKGVLWVATNDGLRRIPFDVTDVAVSNDLLRYTSVWAYPTPVQDASVTIRVNNLDLQGNVISRLRVLDVNGIEIQNLSGSVILDHRSQRQEFTISTAALANGLYFVVLDAGTYRTVARVLVARPR